MYNKVYKMKILYIVSFLAVNFVTAAVAYYKMCYRQFSICTITNTEIILSKTDLRGKWKADEWCRENSSSLATITNGTVQSALLAFIGDSSAKLDSDVHVITNAYRSKLQADEWLWTNGIRSGIQPQLDGYYPRYAYLRVAAGGRSATIRASAPTSARYFICSYRISRNSGCPDDHHQLGNSCYKIHNDNARTWFGARNLCLEEGRDLATFEDIDVSRLSGWLRNGDYWIGLLNEKWHWGYGERQVELTYSNWDYRRPSLTDDNCICLTTYTGKWKDCACLDKYRYICIQGYAPDSSDVSKSTTTTPSIQATTIHTVHDSKFQQMSDDNSKSKADEKSTEGINSTPLNADMLLAFGLGIAFLLILITVVAVVTFIKIRRSRSHDPQLSRDSPSTGMELTSAYVPTAVYAVVVPNAGEHTRSPSEKTPTQVIYAELELERKGTTDGTAARELEYANSMELDSVYANSAAQTREYRHDCGRVE